MDTSNNFPQNNNRVGSLPNRVVLFFFLIGLFFIIGGVGYFYSRQSKTPRTITTIGTGKADVQAQKTRIMIVMVNRGANKSELISSSRTEFADVIASLQSLQVDAISQSSPQVIPTSSTTSAGQSVFNNFEYRQGAQVDVSDSSRVEQVFDYLNSKNIFVAQTTYLPPDQSSVDGQLLKSALENATTKATELTSQANLRVGKILNVTEVTASQDNAGLVSVNNGGTAQVGQATSLSNIQLQKTISVTFELY